MRHRFKTKQQSTGSQGEGKETRDMKYKCWLVIIMITVIGIVTIPAQEMSNPLIGTWLLTSKRVPMALLICFKDDTYEILARIVHHEGSPINIVNLDGDAKPRAYSVKNLMVEGPIVQFDVEIEGTPFGVYGASNLPNGFRLYLFIGKELTGDIMIQIH